LENKIDKKHSILEYLFYWNRPISPGVLTKQLEMKHSTLNSALKRLENQNLIQWDKYSQVQLTVEGKEQASHLSNHHFIVEKFLTDVLNLSPSLAHDEALNLSPYISCTVIDAMCVKMQISNDTLNSDFCKQRTYIG